MILERRASQGSQTQQLHRINSMWVTLREMTLALNFQHALSQLPRRWLLALVITTVECLSR